MHVRTRIAPDVVGDLWTISYSYDTETLSVELRSFFVDPKATFNSVSCPQLWRFLSLECALVLHTLYANKRDPVCAYDHISLDSRSKMRYIKAAYFCSSGMNIEIALSTRGKSETATSSVSRCFEFEFADDDVCE